MTLFKQIFGLALFVLVVNYFYPAQKKPDLVRERMIYDQSLSEVFDGEHSYINYKYGKFSSLEIYNDDKDSAILYLHGRGLSPNDYNLAHPIRTQLSGNFNTYNIQLPVLEKGSTYNDYVDILYDSDQRIISAIDYISSKNDRLVIIAHSCGVHMLMSFIENFHLPPQVIAIVMVGSGAVDKGQKLVREYPYHKINIPILDIYGEYDFDLVRKEASKREKLIKIVSDKSTQYEIKSSSHYHEDNADKVIQIVKKWLSDK